MPKKRKFQLAVDNLITRGAGYQSDAIFLTLQDKKLTRKELAHSRLALRRADDISGIADTTWHTAGLCVAHHPRQAMIAVSDDGDVFTYSEPEQGTERIAGCRGLRGCAAIEGHAYACGMARQVFRRDQENQWSAMHAPYTQKEGIAGFEAIAGFNQQDIYATGWEGEIWQYNGRTWSNCKSPADVILSGVCCAADGFVYVCGQGGALLRGRHQTWTLIDGGVLTDFWDVAWFQGALFVSSMDRLFKLEAGHLVPVDFGRDIPDTCHKLSVGEGVLWSIGQQDVFAFDGETWTRWA